VRSSSILAGKHAATGSCVVVSGARNGSRSARGSISSFSLGSFSDLSGGSGNGSDSNSNVTSLFNSCVVKASGIDPSELGPNGALPWHYIRFVTFVQPLCGMMLELQY
jgi:hypothetical protein